MFDIEKLQKHEQYLLKLACANRLQSSQHLQSTQQS